MANIGTSKIFELVIGVILVAYFIGATWGGIQTALSNTTGQGSTLIALVPLMLAVGVIYLLYKHFVVQ